MINRLDDSTIFHILHRAIKNNRPYLMVEDVAITCRLPLPSDYYERQYMKKRALSIISEMEERGLIAHFLRRDGTHAWAITLQGKTFHDWRCKKKSTRQVTI